MSLKIVLGAGHGGGGSTPGKRSPIGEYEWDFNDAVADGFMEEMDKYIGVEIMRIDDDDASDGLEDIALSERVRKANNWKADYYISFHHNANTGKWGNWTGTETFYYKGSSEGKKLAEIVHKAMLETYGLKDRGIKEGNWLYIVKNSTMPCVLTEGGFMDSNLDIKVLRDRNKLEKAGRKVAQNIAEWKGLKKRSSSKPSTNNEVKKPSNSAKELYRVRKSWSDVKSQKGAFYDLNNAKEVANEHAGYEVYNEAGKIVYSGKGATSSNNKTNKKKWNFSNKTLRHGNRGEDVRYLQLALCEAHFYPNKDAKNNGVDSIYGKDTKDAVRRFQSVYLPYEVDGIFGPKTRKALEKLLNK